MQRWEEVAKSKARRAKVAAVREVQRFAREREAVFERVTRIAGERFTDEFDADRLLRDPVKYCKGLFARVGGEVVRDLMPKAERAGRKHAERLLAAQDQRP